MVDPGVQFVQDLTRDATGMRHYSYKRGSRWLPRWKWEEVEWVWVPDAQSVGKYGLAVVNIRRAQWSYIERSGEWRDRIWVIEHILSFIDDIGKNNGRARVGREWTMGAVAAEVQQDIREWSTGIMVMRDMEMLICGEEVEVVVRRDDIDMQRVRIAEIIMGSRHSAYGKVGGTIEMNRSDGTVGMIRELKGFASEVVLMTVNRCMLRCSIMELIESEVNANCTRLLCACEPEMRDVC